MEGWYKRRGDHLGGKIWRREIRLGEKVITLWPCRRRSLKKIARTVCQSTTTLLPKFDCCILCDCKYNIDYKKMLFSVWFISVDLVICFCYLLSILSLRIRIDSFILILCKRQICKVRDSNPRNLLQLWELKSHALDHSANLALTVWKV